MVDVEAVRIVSTPEVLDGEPRIEGRRLSVRFIRDQVEERGLDPKSVAAEYDLDVSAVYRALVYYHEHPSEMADAERKRDRLVERYADEPDTISGPGDR